MFISHNISLLTSLLISSAVFSMPYGIGCVSDINSDGIVGVSDVLSVIDAWGTSNEDADCNGDGMFCLVVLRCLGCSIPLNHRMVQLGGLVFHRFQ